MARFFMFLLLASALISVQIAVSKAQEKNFKPSTWAEWNREFTPRIPGKTWQKFASPEEAGWSSEKLAEVRNLSKAIGSAAVMIVYDGVVLVEWGEVERRFMGHSMRKSLLSALYGIAVERGQIDLNESMGALRINDDTALTVEEKTAKISDLLKARSGVYLPAAYETKGMKESRPKRGSHKPGNHWYYNNWDFNALATIYNRKTKGDLFKAFKSQIADPLQMQDFNPRHTYYHLEAHNSRHAAYPFRMSARDLARFGLLFLNEGAWNGRQIISADWVRESTKSYSGSERDGVGYGYMWWRFLGPTTDLGTYAAAGYGGHRIIVVPEARLVMIHRSNTYIDTRISGNQIGILLRSVLRARIGTARKYPQIVNRKQQTTFEESSPPSKAEIEATLGQYRSQRFLWTISQRSNGLKAHSPTFGSFNLLRVGEYEYLMEDALYHVRFEGDKSAPATRLTITYPHDKPLKLWRVP